MAVQQKQAVLASLRWWSLGAICFEMLAGLPPFHHETPAAIFAAILRGDIHWDAFDEGIAASASADDGTIEAGVDAARSLITRLLHPLPELRLGGTAVQAHRFFAGLDWRALYDAPPPFRPKLEHDEDTSYFADRRRHGLPFAHEWQEMLAADAPYASQCFVIVRLLGARNLALARDAP